MSYKNSASTFLDELEEEKLIREYEQECAEEVLDIKKFNSNSTIKSINLIDDKFDRCLNISDNEYLENLSILDNESVRTIPVKPLYIDTSIPQYALDNLKGLDKFKELTSSTSTINSSQLNEDNLLNSSSTANNSNHSSNDNLTEQNNVSLFKNNIRRKKTKCPITFELISARTVQPSELINYLNDDNNSTSKRFVLYTIIIKRIKGLETHPAIIEKRYSEFLNFFLELRKNFPTLFEQFPFPKKIYSNNFEADVISERSIVFQHLLTYCLSVKELRNSIVFKEFILNSEFKKCRRLIRSKNFEEAVMNLENLLFILSKLDQIETTNYIQLTIFTTYLALSACLNECENYAESAHYGEQAFKMIIFNEDFDKNELIMPFLLLLIELNSRLNRCCKDQNQKLLELSDKGITYEKKESLIDLFILKNYFILRP